MKKETPLVDQDYLLQKIGEKCAWTFAEIPEVPLAKTPFGMLKVKGTIDNHEISDTSLMPMGNGNLGLPIKAAIRKKIKKQAGDTVHIILYKDNIRKEVPEELLLCLQYEEGIIEKFKTYTPGQQKVFMDWIYSAKTEQTKAVRIAKTIEMIQNNKKPNDKK